MWITFSYSITQLSIPSWFPSEDLVTGKLVFNLEVKLEKPPPMVKMLLCLYMLAHIPHKQVSHWNPSARPTEAGEVMQLGKKGTNSLN